MTAVTVGDRVLTPTLLPDGIAWLPAGVQLDGQQGQVQADPTPPGTFDEPLDAFRITINLGMQKRNVGKLVDEGISIPEAPLSLVYASNKPNQTSGK